jgi:hypothetical protein
MKKHGLHPGKSVKRVGKDTFLILNIYYGMITHLMNL